MKSPAFLHVNKISYNVLCILCFMFLACQASQEAKKGESECRCC